MPDLRLIERWLPIAEIGIESMRERTPMTAVPGAESAARVVGATAAGGVPGGDLGVAATVLSQLTSLPTDAWCRAARGVRLLPQRAWPAASAKLATMG